MLAQFFDGGDKVTAETAEMGGFSIIQPEDVAEVATWLLGEESGKVWGANIPVGAAPP